MLIRLMVSLVLAVTIALPALAQSSSKETVVLLKLSGKPDSILTIYSKPGQTPAAVITVPNGTDPESLAGAFVVLNRMHKQIKRADLPPSTESLLRFEVPRKTRRASLTPEERSFYRGYLTSFDRAHEVDVPGIGRGRAVEVLMPDWPVTP